MRRCLRRRRLSVVAVAVVVAVAAVVVTEAASGDLFRNVTNHNNAAFQNC